MSLREIANRMRAHETLVEIAEALNVEHRAEVAKLDLAWWCVMPSLHGRFLGGIFVWAFGPVDAADEVRKRELLDVALPYTLTFARLAKAPPVAARFKLLTLDELKAIETETEAERA